MRGCPCGALSPLAIPEDFPLGAHFTFRLRRGGARRCWRGWWGATAPFREELGALPCPRVKSGFATAPIGEEVWCLSLLKRELEDWALPRPSVKSPAGQNFQIILAHGRYRAPQWSPVADIFPLQ